MKKLIVISLVLLSAIPAMAMADYRTDRAEIMASAGLFNVAALDNPVYAEQVKNMTGETSRGRVRLNGVTKSGDNVNIVTDESSSLERFESFIENIRFTGKGSDETNSYKYIFYYNNGQIISGSLSDSRGHNRTVTYSQYTSRRP